MAALTLAEMRERLEELRRDLEEGDKGHTGLVITSVAVLGPAVELASAELARREREALKLNGAWRCSCCGELMEAGDSRWRWNGQAWEHSHGQAGHFEARDFSPVTDGEAG